MAFKIEMMMATAARIERGSAGRASRIRLQVIANGQFSLTRSTEDGTLVPFAARPHHNGVAGERDVAILASIIKAAALHLDGHDVQSGAVVRAASLRIHFDPADRRP